MKKLLLCLGVAAVCLVTDAPAASVGPAGYFTDFSTRPAVTDWSTRSIAGGASGTTDSTNAFMVDTNVALITANSITNQVLNFDPTNPPDANAIASWTSGGGAYLLTRPVGVMMTLLLATLTNNTGSNVAAVNIHYTLTVASTAAEEVPGQRVYYSFTGAAGSWMNIAAPSASGPVDASISGTWLAGNVLYILIADDNGTGVPDTANEIDNFSVTTAGGGPVTEAIIITAPTEGQNIVEQATFPVTAITSGTITNAAFYLDGVRVGSDTNTPYSVTFSNVVLGAHTLTAVANSSVTSAPVHITIVANHPPTLALTTAQGAVTVLTGLTITNTPVITDNDPGGSIQRVEYSVDGTPRHTNSTSPFAFYLCDVLAGIHTITAVAVDQAGARATNSNTLTATNPSNVTVIIPNGSSWKYLDKGTDQGTGGIPWAGLAFDDSGWSNGVAELGYGDAAGNDRPETTVVSYGPNGNAKYITTYFRKSFVVASPSVFTNLIVRLLRDDGGIVYLNGAEVFRSNMTNGTVTYTNFAGPAATGPAAADDGTVYQVTNLSNTLIEGPNVIAVEIHQDALGSSDISFDLMLWGQQPNLPRLTITRTNVTHVDLTWPNPSTGYQLWYKDALENSAWIQDTDDVAISGSDGAWHAIINISSGKRFFRLQHP